MIDGNGMALGVAHGTPSGRALLRALVAELAGATPIDPDAVIIEARCPDCGGDHGRPVVMAPDAARHIHVGLSHVGDTVVGVASADRSVGIDAEPAGALADGERAQRIRELIGRHDGDPLRRWTAIEAVLKADGRGLRVDPATVSLDPLEPLDPADPADPRASHTSAWRASVPGDTRRYIVTEVAVEGLVVSVAREL